MGIIIKYMVGIDLIFSTIYYLPLKITNAFNDLLIVPVESMVIFINKSNDISSPLCKR